MSIEGAADMYFTFDRSLRHFAILFVYSPKVLAQTLLQKHEEPFQKIRSFHLLVATPGNSLHVDRTASLNGHAERWREVRSSPVDDTTRSW